MSLYDVTLEDAEGAALVSVPKQASRPAEEERSPVVERRRQTEFEFDVALVGLGYVGLPTALAFHAAGRSVLGLDISEQRREAIYNQRVDLLDSDKERLDRALRDSAAFRFTGDPTDLSRARAVLIAVPTPVDDHLLPDLSMLSSAAQVVVEHAVPGQVLIMTSTSYVGSTQDMLVAPLSARNFTVGHDIHVAFSPERIDPGNDRHKHEDVPRVLGGFTRECAEAARTALGAYATNVHIVSSPAAAEMTKLMENTFRAVNIALANEFAEISRTLELDAIEVLNAASTKPYGFMPFYPGPGVGGHCIPCDPHYLLWQLRSSRLPTPVIQQAMQSIAGRPARVVDRVREILSLNGKGLAGSRVLVLGVAYKPDVEDVRESSALEIIAGLADAGAEVGFYDPLVPVVTSHDGQPVLSVADPRAFEADLVVAHTLHSCLDLQWLEDAPLILDASYRLPQHLQRFTL
jgi:nucleotide sugar dehydrogenase